MISIAATMALALAGAPSGVIAAWPTEPAEVSDIVRSALATARADAARIRTDRFAEPSDLHGVVGAPFRVRLPLGDGDAPTGYLTRGAYFTFKDGMFTATMSRYGSYVGVRGPAVAVAISSANTLGEPFVGQNGYGAQWTVSRNTVVTDQLALMSYPTGTFSYSRAARGEEARALAASVAVVIEGSIAALPSGRVTDCGTHAIEATVQRPNEVLTYVCWVAVDVQRVAIVDGPADTVLQEWVR